MGPVNTFTKLEPPNPSIDLLLCGSEMSLDGYKIVKRSVRVGPCSKELFSSRPSAQYEGLDERGQNPSKKSILASMNCQSITLRNTARYYEEDTSTMSLGTIRGQENDSILFVVTGSIS